MKGTLVCFEGLDNSGKTTLVNRLSELLKLDEIPVKVYSFPNKQCLTYNLIESYHLEFIDLDPKAAHLLYSANRWEVHDEILNYLEKGYIVLLDRYFYSGIAYSCGYNDIDLAWACQVEAGLVVPDITFYFETSRDVRMARYNANPEHARFDTMEIQEKVERIYKQLITKSWIIVDGDKSIEDVCNFVSLKINPFILQ